MCVAGTSPLQAFVTLQCERWKRGVARSKYLGDLQAGLPVARLAAHAERRD